MNVTIRAFAAAALIAVGTGATVQAADLAEVSYQIYDFYHPTELLSDTTIRVTARNTATGATFTADERSGQAFSLPAGTYTFSGRSQWCYLAETTVSITADTSLALYAGCE